MKKYQLPQGKILGAKLGIAIINTLRFISVLKKEMTEQTNRPLRVMLIAFGLFPSFPESQKRQHTPVTV